jgi:hypothetical protein
MKRFIIGPMQERSYEMVAIIAAIMLCAEQPRAFDILEAPVQRFAVWPSVQIEFAPPNVIVE